MNSFLLSWYKLKVKTASFSQIFDGKDYINLLVLKTIYLNKNLKNLIFFLNEILINITGF